MKGYGLRVTGLTAYEEPSATWPWPPQTRNPWPVGNRERRNEVPASLARHFLARAHARERASIAICLSRREERLNRASAKKRPLRFPLTLRQFNAVMAALTLAKRLGAQGRKARAIRARSARTPEPFTLARSRVG